MKSTNSINSKYKQLDYIQTKLDEGQVKKEYYFILGGLSKDKDALIRSKVAELLIFFNDNSEILLELSKDKDSLVRAEACDSLCYSSSMGVYNRLKTIVKNDKNGMVRGYAATFLGDVAKTIGNEDITIEFLIDRLKKEKVIFTIINIYSSLIVLGENKYFDKIVKLLNTQRYQNRCAVVSSFYDIVDDNNKKTVIKALLKRKEVEKSVAVYSAIDELLEYLDE